MYSLLTCSDIMFHTYWYFLLPCILIFEMFKMHKMTLQIFFLKKENKNASKGSKQMASDVQISIQVNKNIIQLFLPLSFLLSFSNNIQNNTHLFNCTAAFISLQKTIQPEVILNCLSFRISVSACVYSHLSLLRSNLLHIKNKQTTKNHPHINHDLSTQTFLAN